MGIRRLRDWQQDQHGAQLPERPGAAGHRTTKKGRTSQYCGVCWNKSAKKRKAQTSVDGKQKYLGIFVDKDDAVRAYDAAVRKHEPGVRPHGWKRFNFPSADGEEGSTDGGGASSSSAVVAARAAEEEEASSSREEKRAHRRTHARRARLRCQGPHRGDVDAHLLARHNESELRSKAAIAAARPMRTARAGAPRQSERRRPAARGASAPVLAPRLAELYR